MSKHIKLYILNVCIFLHVCYTLVKLSDRFLFFVFFSLKKCVKIEAGRKTVEQLGARLTSRTASIIIQHSHLEL